MTDRQNRVGSKFGGGGVSSAQQSERERKERLKALALESIDLARDPYLVQNHLGGYECRLCLTLHRDEANYLAHTQGKKHQQGLQRRAHQEKLRAERDGTSTSDSAGVGPSTETKPTAQHASVTIVKIGRPAYQVYKSRDAETNQRVLSFEIAFPEINANLQPRHRFVSTYAAQSKSSAGNNSTNKSKDSRYQYLVIAAAPYETIAFKVPNEPIDRTPERFVTHWDTKTKTFTIAYMYL